MITLHLHGQLAKDFGSCVRLEAETPREAVIALSYQCPKYKDILVSNNWHIFVGEGNDITENELDLKLGKITDVYLVPVIQGANNGVFNFIIGAVLTVVGAVLNVGSFGSASALGVPMMSAGIGMMIGGLIQMTTKVPGVDDMSRDSADQKASFLFNGPTNTASQGVAIPRGYGRMLVGSVVVSAALYAEQIEYVDPAIEEDYPELVQGTVWSKFNTDTNVVNP